MIFYRTVKASYTAPSPYEGVIWLDLNSNVLKKWSNTQGKWIPIGCECLNDDSNPSNPNTPNPPNTNDPTTDPDVDTVSLLVSNIQEYANNIVTSASTVEFVISGEGNTENSVNNISSCTANIIGTTNEGITNDIDMEWVDLGFTSGNLWRRRGLDEWYPGDFKHLVFYSLIANSPIFDEESKTPQQCIQRGTAGGFSGDYRKPISELQALGIVGDVYSFDGDEYADLLPAHDIVSIKMGSQYRQPSIKDAHELFNNCSTSIVKGNATHSRGIKFTSKKNGNSVTIFGGQSSHWNVVSNKLIMDHQGGHYEFPNSKWFNIGMSFFNTSRNLIGGPVPTDDCANMEVIVYDDSYHILSNWDGKHGVVNERYQMTITVPIKNKY